MDFEEITEVTPAEIGQLQDFAKRTFASTYGHLNDPDNFQQYLEDAFRIESLKREFEHPNSTFYFLKRNEEPIAYIKLNIDGAQTEPNHPDGLEIERIYVDKAFQRLGIGRKLIDFAYDRAQTLQKEYIWLGVWRQNKNAIDFYKQIGFKKIGTHIFQLGQETQIDYMMAKDIAAP